MEQRAKLRFKQMEFFFRKFSQRIAGFVGNPIAFFMAVVVIVAWAITGPMFGFSDTWQLVINTGTTIITFLMVFLIQNTQNRDSKAINLKLDELIVAVKSAHNNLVEVNELSDIQLEKLEEKFKKMAHKRS
ncbi:low affinity iron permease family protein [bacterium]|nr:low affinity iron permease family protein [bacterium]